MKRVVTPVVTEDIVSYLLRRMDEYGKFSRVYKCIMSEAILVRAWFEIKSRSWRFVSPKLDRYYNANKVENVALNWFKKINHLLVLDKYNYNCTRVLSISKKKTDKH